ncbi:hypothetical protein CK203_099117 [Vitis vinifera]|uniref:Endonuclease/exonuclease/phosphatase domain-containing protein n=1 Tax=Vitis vinifera TaxID=29760 RepID=A0A438CWN2_VITVI|nr:hypothetical protein CK203_099117 [Vitis vinifera]
MQSGVSCTKYGIGKRSPYSYTPKNLTALELQTHNGDEEIYRGDWELGLRDFPLAGGPFTWIGGLNSQAASRLDRFLISDPWEDHFSAITQSALPRLVSDHSPIVLEAGGFSTGKSPFRFENMWLKLDGFKDLVRSWWNGYSVEGYSSHCIAEKLKALKKDLKNWNKEVVATFLLIGQRPFPACSDGRPRRMKAL